MKQTNPVKTPLNIEKKEGKTIEEIKNALEVFQKEKDIINSETQVKQKEPEPQGVIPPIKTNLKVGVIPCVNLKIQKEEKTSSENKEVKMEIDTNFDINEFQQIETQIELPEENKNIEQKKEKIEKQKNINVETANNNHENKPEQNNEKNKINENASKENIQQSTKDEQIKNLSNELNLITPQEKAKESNNIQNNTPKDERENLEQKQTEEISKTTTQNETQLSNNEPIPIQQIQSIIDNNQENFNEESNNLIINSEKENQNPNMDIDNKSIINTNEESLPKNEKDVQNNTQPQLVDAIGNVVDTHLNNIEKEEVRKFFGLKTEEEVDQFFNKVKENNTNDISIHPGSPSLSQLTGIKNENSIFSGANYHDNILEELTKNLPRRSLLGLPNKEYFISKYVNNYNNILYNPYDYKYQDVKDDGNGGYRCIALQLLGNEDFHNDIRMDVYNFLHHNKDNFTHLTFQIDGKEVTAGEYIENIKNPGFEMGDLELYVMNLIYNAILFIFQLKDEDELSLIHIKGNIKNMNCILLTICIVDEDHFNVIYEKYRGLEEPKKVKNNLNINLDNIINKTLITDINIAYELNYANDNRKYRYKDMINYMISKKFNREPTYPEFIYDIKAKQLRTNKKKEFKKSLKNYFIDEKTKRLKVKFNFNKVKEMINKEYFIPFQIEKIKLIKHLHEASTHKGQVLSELVKKSDYWWYGIYQDIKNSANFCPLCQKKPKTKIIKPRPFFSKNLYCSSSNDIFP